MTVRWFLGELARLVRCGRRLGAHQQQPHNNCDFLIFSRIIFSAKLYFLNIFVTLPLLDNRNYLKFSSGDLIGNYSDFLIFFKDGSDDNGIVTAAMVLVMMFVFVVTILGIGSGRLACWQGAIQMNNNKTLSFCKYTPQRYII